MEATPPRCGPESPTLFSSDITLRTGTVRCAPILLAVLATGRYLHTLFLTPPLCSGEVDPRTVRCLSAIKLYLHSSCLALFNPLQYIEACCPPFFVGTLYYSFLNHPLLFSFPLLSSAPLSSPPGRPLSPVLQCVRTERRAFPLHDGSDSNAFTANPPVVVVTANGATTKAMTSRQSIEPIHE